MLLLCIASPSFAVEERRADSLQQLLKTEQNDTTRIRTLLELSSVFEADSIALSFYYANEALFHSERVGWQKGITSAELRVAICYVNVWELREAIRHLNKGIFASRRTGNERAERACWQYLVHCYDHIGEHRKAFECQSHLLKMFMRTGDTMAICRQMSAYATCMFDDGRKQEGINWLNTDVVLAENHLHERTRNSIAAELLNTLAIQYLKLERTDSAFLCVRKGLSYAYAINDTPNIAYLISTLCYAHSDVGNYDSAEYYSRKTIALAEYMRDLSLLKNHHAQSAVIYEKLQRPGLALQHYKAADSIGVIITGSEKTLEESMQISRVAIAQQALHRQQEKKDLEVINSGQRKALTVVIGIVIALAIIAALIYRNMKDKEHKNKIIRAQAEDLQQQNVVIDAALRDKEILLQEMHHRVKNNLQLINGLLELQIAQLKDRSSVDALTVAQQRIFSMAMVHSRLYNNSGDATVEVHDFAADLFQSLANAFGGSESDVRFEDNIARAHLPLDILVPLGLILNELITNSFKHAFKTTADPLVTLDLEREDGNIILTYTDNGSGMDISSLGEDPGTLGIYLIRRLTRQLKGELTYSYRNGSKFTFTFPYERDPDRHS